MISYPKRLIEIDLPIRRISAHSRREKSIRHGHISTLHIWWARRPLAACRAVICAALWPDPSDPLCPESFRIKARALMKKWVIDNLNLLGEESYKRFVRFQKNLTRLDDNIELRKALLDFIADFSNWDNSNKSEYLETSRVLTQSAHESMGGELDSRPLVIDPFAGGGAIPLEALRVGAEAFASDINPVAVLLNKVVLNYIPKYGQQLADEVRRWSEWIKKEAEKELAELYPKDLGGTTPIAYLWARTISCEGPGCGAQIPLMRSLTLAKKGNHSVALKIITDKKKKWIGFEVANVKERDITQGTVRQGSATCPICGYTTPVQQVRKQISDNHGGASNARLVCIVTTNKESRGRSYRIPNINDFKPIKRAAQLCNDLRNDLLMKHLIPTEETPVDGTGSKGGGYRTRKYGITSFQHFFTPRQLLTLIKFTDLVRECKKQMTSLLERDISEAVEVILSLAVSKLADRNSAFCRWISQNENVGYTFGRQAIPMMWDFIESPPLTAGGGWSGMISDIITTIEFQSVIRQEGNIMQASANELPLPHDSANALITDPPYYDAVPYAELSDFFYVWLKRMLKDSNNELFINLLTPKIGECIVDLKKGMTKEYFETTMGQAMTEGRKVLAPSGIGIVVFAHKSTSGWEAQLQAMIDAGWIITGSWPIDTERPGRLRAQNSAALASSIHMVCRPRENIDGALLTENIGDWRDVLYELPKRIHEWMPRLAAEGIVGADAIFACLGPALEIFSRYSYVEKASGEIVSLKEFLEQVWAAVAKEALNMIFEGAEASGFEEDSRLTAMWLWTLSTDVNGNGKNGHSFDDEENDDRTYIGNSKQATGGYVLEYDAARKIAQGLGAYLEKLNSVVEIKGDVARLLPVSERARFLFGTGKGHVEKKSRKKEKQLTFFDVIELEEESWGWDKNSAPIAGESVLDHLHQTMLLFAAGRGEAIKRFLVEDGIGRDQRFWSLAQALSALYPPHSDEKRWVDGVLARKKGLGF